MKQIELPISKNFYSNVVDVVVDGSTSGKENENSLQAMLFKDLDQARQNGGQVIWCAICLEKKLELILSTFLFPKSEHQCTKEKSFFTSKIIGADVLSYADKKKLVVTIINDQGSLKGKDKDKFTKVLTTVMEYRNAFAHGDIAFHADSGCNLKYWKGALKHVVLNDEYWEKLEKCFRDAHDLSDQVISSLSK